MNFISVSALALALALMACVGPDEAQNPPSAPIAQNTSPVYSDVCELPGGRQPQMAEWVEVGSDCAFQEGNGEWTKGRVVPAPRARAYSLSGEHAVPAPNARRRPPRN